MGISWPAYGLTVSLVDDEIGQPNGSVSPDAVVDRVVEGPDGRVRVRCVGAWPGTESLVQVACDGFRMLTPRERARAFRTQRRQASRAARTRRSP